MKKTIYAAMLFVATVAFMACEKEDIKTTQTEVKEKPQANANTKVAVSISLDLPSYNCGPIAPCTTGGGNSPRLNMIEIYNEGYPGVPTLTYKFYRKISTSGTIETFQPIPGAQYTCTSDYAPYASSYLTNGLKVLVVAIAGSAGPSANTNITYDTSTGSLVSYPSMPAAWAHKFITMANYQGLPCMH